jgi:hypothetical protein
VAQPSSHTIAANVTLMKPTDINVAAGGFLTLAGTLNVPFGFSASANGPGTLNLTGSQTFSANSSFTVNGGAVNFGGAAGLASAINLPGTLGINGNATVTLLPSASSATRVTGNYVKQLAITGNGLLDLGNHFLQVDNSATPESAVRLYLKNAYNADPGTGIGNWLGRGGITSSDAINSHNVTQDFRVSIGYVNGAAALDPLIGGAIPGQETLPTNRILIRPALYGDLNLDGKVDDVDLAIFSGLGQYNQPADKFGWLGGDLNHDGKVDDTDLQIFSGAGNYNGPSYGAAGAGASHTSATPNLTGHAEASGDIVLSAGTSAGAPGDGVLDFVYDPATGHLTLSYDGDPRVTAAQPFQVVRFKSAGGHFEPGNFNQTDFGAGVTATATALNGTASGANSVPDGYDMGAVLPAGLTIADLTSDLTLQWNVFGGGLTLKNGDVVVPEPAPVALIALAATSLLLSRRRRGILPSPTSSGTS